MLYADDECDDCEGFNVVRKLIKVEKILDENVKGEVVRHWYSYYCRDCTATFKDWKEVQTNDRGTA